MAFDRWNKITINIIRFNTINHRFNYIFSKLARAMLE